MSGLHESSGITRDGSTFFGRVYHQSEVRKNFVYTMNGKPLTRVSTYSRCRFQTYYVWRQNSSWTSVVSASALFDSSRSFAASCYCRRLHLTCHLPLPYGPWHDRPPKYLYSNSPRSTDDKELYDRSITLGPMHPQAVERSCNSMCCLHRNFDIMDSAHSSFVTVMKALLFRRSERDFNSRCGSHSHAIRVPTNGA